MIRIPLSLLEHLHENGIKMPVFEEKVQKMWVDFDARKDDPKYMTISLFIGTLQMTPPAIPELADFMNELHAEKLDQQNMSSKDPRKGKAPRFILPPDIVFNIKYDRMKEELFSTPVEWKSVFNVPEIRPAQYDLMSQLAQCKTKDIIMKAPTGSGKTMVILAYARLLGLKTMIIEPQKGMETQLQQKYNVPVILGMQHYKCMAEGIPANESSCRVMGNESPCGTGCEWHDAKNSFRRELEGGNPVAVNPGNFWNWADKCEMIVIDEFHQVFTMLTDRHDIPDGTLKETGAEWLSNEIQRLSDEMESLYFTMRDKKSRGVEVTSDEWQYYDRLGYELKWKDFYQSNYEHVGIYSDGSRKYMKMDKEGTIAYFQKIYPNKRLLFVSATPLNVNGATLITTSKSVTSRVNAPIVYYPINNLSAHSIQTNPDYLKAAADSIMLFYRHFRDNGTTRKIIVHSGNTNTHGRGIAQFLTEKGMKVKLHKKGSLKETIDDFKAMDYDALVVASADAGYDFYGDVFGLQFILKVPYPTLNSEWVAIEQKHGASYKWDLYMRETINQIVQASGRICRGYDDVGITMILDTKFADLYNSHEANFPDDFKERLIDLGGNLKNIAPTWQLEHYLKSDA